MSPDREIWFHRKTHDFRVDIWPANTKGWLISIFFIMGLTCLMVASERFAVWFAISERSAGFIGVAIAVVGFVSFAILAFRHSKEVDGLW